MDIYVVLCDYDHASSDYICTACTLADAIEEVDKITNRRVFNADENLSEWKQCNPGVWISRGNTFQYRIIKSVVMT
jgi:hypothetical protein